MTTRQTNAELGELNNLSDAGGSMVHHTNLSSSPFSGLYCAVHVTRPFRGCLRTREVNFSDRFTERPEIAKKKFQSVT